ncbi:MAG: hypothetical protein IJE00_04370 [Clostridia bacterium]|nr:hypothetical protein [Clostridia bacterium]
MKKAGKILRWIFGFYAMIFFIFALANGWLLSSLLMLLASVLILPIPFSEKLLEKIKVKRWMAVALAIVLFFAAIAISPSSPADADETDPPIATTSTSLTTTSEKTTTTTSTTEKIITTTTTTTKVTSTTAGVEMVWIPTKGGTKYHTHAGCSNMDGPIQVTEQEAINQGFTPCKRCH